jgi:hypothetical protein
LIEGHEGVCEELPDTAVNPSYYHGDAVMVFIEEFDLSFCLGNTVKYIARHNHKNKVQDLKKALWYLTREIEAMENGAADPLINAARQL